MHISAHNRRYPKVIVDIDRYSVSQGANDFSEQKKYDEFLKKKKRKSEMEGSQDIGCQNILAKTLNFGTYIWHLLCHGILFLKVE